MNSGTETKRERTTQRESEPHTKRERTTRTHTHTHTHTHTQRETERESGGQKETGPSGGEWRQYLKQGGTQTFKRPTTAPPAASIGMYLQHTEFVNSSITTTTTTTTKMTTQGVFESFSLVQAFNNFTYQIWPLFTHPLLSRFVVFNQV